MSVLEVRDLHAGYGKLRILFGIDMEADRGELIAVVGPNGSGKSTLLKAVLGLATVHRGSVKLEGLELRGLPPHEVARRGVAYLPQTNNVFENLKVRENMRIAGYDLDEDEYADRLERALALFPMLKEKMERRARELSGGERQLLAIAMSLIREPKVLLLDEPTASLAPKYANMILKKLIELRDETRLPIVLVEQNARKALEICDRAYLLASGRLIFSGPPEDLLARKDLVRVYLGIS